MVLLVIEESKNYGEFLDDEIFDKWYLSINGIYIRIDV
jgi:hypothetical protein